MTKIKLSIVSFLLFFALVAQGQSLKIAGKIAHWKNGAEIHLTNMSGTDISIKIDGKGSFSAVIPEIKKGFYSLQGIVSVYLEPGYDIYIALSKDSSQYVFTGKGSFENAATADAKKLITDYFPMNNSAFLFKTYMIGMDTFLNSMSKYKQTAYWLIDRSSSPFYQMLAKKDLNCYCLNYLNNYSVYYGIDSAKQAAFYQLMQSKAANTPGVIDSAYNTAHVKVLTHPQRKMLDSLCFQGLAMNDSVLFVNSADYRKLLGDRITQYIYKDYRSDFMAHKDQSAIKLKAVQKNISNPFIRNYYVYSLTSDIIKMSKDSILKDSVYKAFIASAVDQTYKSSIDQIYHNFINMSAHKMAPDFTYTNIDGMKISLSSLRGKYVYIDVWATWCGPCKMEIPYLSEIEERYHSRKIQFVSLSVDAVASKGVWKEYVKTNKLKGIQVMADNAFQSDFIVKFNINAIPRFILIDPEGKIVSADAKRPSDPELKKLLDKLL